jgi:hypothetical protein
MVSSFSGYGSMQPVRDFWLGVLPERKHRTIHTGSGILCDSASQAWYSKRVVNPVNPVYPCLNLFSAGRSYLLHCPIPKGLRLRVKSLN